jgi:putative nucleotidyltransferase with HDIG domain
MDAYDSPDAEALLSATEKRLQAVRLERSQLIVHGSAAGAFLIAAALLAALVPWHRSFAALHLVLVLLAWVAVERVHFPVAGGWSSPTMLAFVPALFLLPVPLVPLVAMVAIVLRRGPELARGRVPWRGLPVSIADSWFALGPALVLVADGQPGFAWSHWPIYLAALLAQFLFDAVTTTVRCTLAERIDPRVQLPLLSWVYLVDAALAPLGLLIAAATQGRPGLVLLALSPMAMLWLFARERRQRLDETVALSSAYRGTALLLGDIVEADDHYTGMHSREVVDLAVAVARELGLSARQQRDVEFAALLHDVGKIRIPKDIINKPGALDEEEWAIVKRHPVEGAEMLELVGGTLASVGRIVRSSHERYDGGGYPDGLAGEQIPIEARIICACDAYSAMTTDRPYRGAMSLTQALAELRRCAGTQFDPRVVAAIERRLASPQPPSTAPAAIVSGVSVSS